MTQQVVSPESSREPTPKPSRSLRWALAAWILGMVLIQGLGASTKDRLAAERDYYAGTLGHRPADIVRAVRAYLADANDMRRYYAYANAFLGKPYYAYYVRSAASWNAEFRSGEPPQKEDGTLVTPSSMQLPYRDYLVEYPPGVFLATLPPALLLPAGDYGDAYCTLFTVEMALLLSAAIWMCLRLRVYLPGHESALRPPSAALWAAAAMGCFGIGAIATHRFDPVIGLLLVAIGLAACSERWLLSGALLGLAVVSKGVPLLVAPVWLVYLAYRAQLGGPQRLSVSVGKALLGATLVGLLFSIPMFLWTGLSMFDALRYHADRPLQIESTGAAILGMLQAIYPGTIKSVSSFGSMNVVPHGSTLAGVDALLKWSHWPLTGLGIIAVVVHLAVRMKRAVVRKDLAQLTELALRGQCAVMVLFMVFARMFSPQYLIWILPLGLLLSLRVSRGLTGLLLVVFCLTQIVLHALDTLSTWAFVILFLRNGLLLGWSVWLSLTNVRLSHSAGVTLESRLQRV